MNNYDYILQELESGSSIHSIRNTYGAKFKDIKRIAEENNIEICNRDTPLSKMTEENIFLEWQKGFRDVERMAKKYGLSVAKVKSIIRKHDKDFHFKNYEEPSEYQQKVIDTLNLPQNKEKSMKQIANENNWKWSSVLYIAERFAERISRKQEKNFLVEKVRKMSSIDTPQRGWQNKLAKEYKVTRQYINKIKKQIDTEHM